MENQGHREHTTSSNNVSVGEIGTVVGRLTDAKLWVTVIITGVSIINVAFHYEMFFKNIPLRECTLKLVS